MASGSSAATAESARPRRFPGGGTTLGLLALSPLSGALLAGLAVWALAPNLLLIVHALRFHLRLSGADGVIASDQLQYLAWVADAAVHGLAGNLFDIPAGARDWLHPMFTLSGLLRSLGASLPLALWAWKPLAIVVLFAGPAAWARRLLGPSPAAVAAAVALALFLFTPAASVFAWIVGGGSTLRLQTLQAGSELFSAGELWGYLPAALAIGLMPIALLALERAATGKMVPLVLAAALALLVAWLHPWQGVTLVLILVGLLGWGRGVGGRIIVTVGLVAILPLAYYVLLARLDPAWRLSSSVGLPVGFPAVALALGPPLLFAAGAGLRRPGPELAERALILWIPAALVAYLGWGSRPSHALAGISVPLAVLLVRGAARCRLWPAVVLVALALLTLPGLADEARAFRDVERGPGQQYFLSSPDSRALAWINLHAPPGGVLARPAFALEVPAQTDRPVWVGHEFWTPSYGQRAAAAQSLFSGRLPGPAARALVRRSGAGLLLGDCGSADLAPELGALIGSVGRFGCAKVYLIAPGR